MTLGALDMRATTGLLAHPRSALVPEMSSERFAAFLADVRAVGIKTPLDVLADGTVLDGRHRLKAARELGHGEVPVRVVDLGDEDPVEFIFRAAIERRDLTATQLATMGLARQSYREERDAAKMRQREAATRGGAAPRKVPAALPEPSPAPPPPKRSEEARARETRSTVAAAVGVSARTVQKVITVQKAAETMPDVAAMLPKMESGEVSADEVQRLVKINRKHALADELRAAPLPAAKGPYRVIVCDPPWQYEKRADDITHRGRNPYPDMSVEEICALPVGKLAEPDAILWLWTTNAFMRAAFRCLDAWGFTEKTILTWCKDRMGTGDWLRGKTEHCILAVRGKPLVMLTNQTTELRAPLREHSRKPDEFYAMVDALCPGTRLDMFAREARVGWALWGAETEKFS